MLLGMLSFRMAANFTGLSQGFYPQLKLLRFQESLVYNSNKRKTSALMIKPIEILSFIK